MSTSTAVATPHQAVSVKYRSAPGRVTGRLKEALDLVVNEGTDPYEAAAKVGLHARSMRLALARKHVLAYLRAQREVLRQRASAQNIFHAVKMRESSTNEMAKLGAMKFIEAIEETPRLGAGQPSVPGLCVVIVGAQPAPLAAEPVALDVTPVRPAIDVQEELAEASPSALPAPWSDAESEPEPALRPEPAPDYVDRKPRFEDTVAYHQPYRAPPNMAGISDSQPARRAPTNVLSRRRQRHGDG